MTLLSAQKPGPLRLVLDTNVVMALWHFADPKLACLADAVSSGRCLAFTREDCLEELRRVLAYPQFHIPEADRVDIASSYAKGAICWPNPSAEEQVVAEGLPQCRDRDDQKFIALAWDAGVDVLVTRDKLLLKLAKRSPLRERFDIMTPERLCAILAAEEPASALA